MINKQPASSKVMKQKGNSKTNPKTPYKGGMWVARWRVSPAERIRVAHKYLTRTVVVIDRMTDSKGFRIKRSQSLSMAFV